MLRLWSFALVLGSAPLFGAGDQQIRGSIVDPSGAAIGGASVRLLKSDSDEAAHTTADDSGRFQLGIPHPDRYVVKASQQGFRSRRVPVVVSSETQTMDLGNIRLDLAGCDAPGVFCDYFGEAPPPDPVVSRGYLHVQIGCMLAFKLGKVFCPGDPKGTGQSDADVRVTQSGNGVFLTAMNGASLSAPNLPRGDCRDAYPDKSDLRIDGLGPGDDICLYTHDRHWSHVFLIEDVSRESRQIAVWQITRKR